MSEDELLSVFKTSVPFKGIEEIRRENRDEDKVIKDSRVLYEPEEDYYKSQKLKGALHDEYIEYESNEDIYKKLSIEEYLNMIRPYLSSITDHYKDGWKIQLTREISFVSTVKDSNKKFNKDSNESYPIHIYSDNSFIFIVYETNNIIKKLFKSFSKEYQESLKTKMKRNSLAFHSVDALYYKLHKISLNIGGSYIDSPKWLKDGKATINPKNKKR